MTYYSIRTNGLLILYCTQRLSVIRGSIRTNILFILYCAQRLSVDSWILTSSEQHFISFQFDKELVLRFDDGSMM